MTFDAVLAFAPPGSLAPYVMAVSVIVDQRTMWAVANRRSRVLCRKRADESRPAYQAGQQCEKSCTPPSGLPSACRMKRASRTGPFAVMNDGTVFPGDGQSTGKLGIGRGDYFLPRPAGCGNRRKNPGETRAEPIGNAFHLRELRVLRGW